MIELAKDPEPRNALGRTARVQRVYDAGMNLCDALRLVGMHEESKDLEDYILNLVVDLSALEITDTVSETSEVAK